VVCAGPILVSSVPPHPCADHVAPSQSDPAPSSTPHTGVFPCRLSSPHNPVSTMVRSVVVVVDTDSNKVHSILCSDFKSGFMSLNGPRQSTNLQTQKDAECMQIQIQAVQHLLLKWPAARNYHSVENAYSNKNVFSLRLKMLQSVISWIAWGRLFQALGPAWKTWEKQCSPNFSRVVSGS